MGGWQEIFKDIFQGPAKCGLLANVLGEQDLFRCVQVSGYVYTEAAVPASLGRDWAGGVDTSGCVSVAEQSLCWVFLFNRTAYLLLKSTRHGFDFRSRLSGFEFLRWIPVV